MPSGGSYSLQYTTTTTNSYAWYDGAVQDYLSYAKTGQSTYTTDYFLNDAGQLTKAEIRDGRWRDVTYTNDLNGLAIRRDEADNVAWNSSNNTGGDPHEIWYRFSGKQMGFTGNNGSLDSDYTTSIATRTQVAPATPGAFKNGAAIGQAAFEFDPSLQRINSYRQGGAGGSYTVRAGDTLQGIAALLWGDSNLWYKLAEANGLSSASGLSEGRALTIPAGIQANSHNAATFRPYDAADAMGETSPTNPKPSKKSNKCGAFGAILLTVVAVAVTVVTAGAAIAVLGPAGTSLGAGIATMLGASGGLAVGSAAAVAAGTGITTGSFALAGAIGGAVGSIASQGLGVATGLQDKFDWKGVALGALSGAAGAGLGAANGLSGGGFMGGLTRGVIGSALTQGVGTVTGLQSKFDFVGVAAAALGGGAAAAIGGAARGLGRFGSSLAANTAGGIANAAVRTLANGGSFGDNLIRALPDVIGSTIGNALAGAAAGTRGAANAVLAAKEAASLANAAATGIKAGEIVVTNSSNWLTTAVGARVTFTQMVDQAARTRAQQFLAAAGGDARAAREMLMRAYEQPTVPASSGPTGVIRNMQLSGGGYDGTRDAIVSIGDHWNEGMTSFGHLEATDASMTSAFWVENAETMARVNADLAQFDRQVGLLGLAMAGGGAGGTAVSLLAPLAGLGTFGTGALIVGGDGVVGGLTGIPMRSALGAENNLWTFTQDTLLSSGNSFLLRGASFAFGRFGGGAVAEPTTASYSPSQIEVNAAAGRAHQQRVSNMGTDTLDGFVQEVTIRPNTSTGPADFRIRIDGMGNDPLDNVINLLEAKASATAPLTRNQRLGFPLLERYGGTVVGNRGNPTFPAGTSIPQGTGVRIIRPRDLLPGY